MGRSNTRFGKLDRVFDEGRSELLNRVAQISVLYEDLRLETEVLFKRAQVVTSPADIKNPFEIYYFVRRSLVSLLEYSGALNQLTGVREFKQKKAFLAGKDADYIQQANLYFQENHQLLKRLRNEFGGHLSFDYAAGSAAKFEPGELGKVSWEQGDDTWSLKLDYAASIVTAGLRHMNPGQDWLNQFLSAVEVIGQSYNHAQGATYALVHAFLWDRFG